MPSIWERIKGKKEEERELTEKEREECGRKVLESIHTTGVQREIYGMKVQEAIIKARNAAAANDPTRKALAMQELKMCYGVYRYMDTLHTAYQTMDAQMQMQKLTQSFAGVVNSMAEINVKQPKLDFGLLTKKALTGIRGLDLTGMEEMVNQLVSGTNAATSVSTVDDPFLEKLVSGEVTVDSPYTLPASVQAAAQTAAPAAVPAAEKSGDELIESMLAQLSEGLSES